jgi:hypothetical protein
MDLSRASQTSELAGLAQSGEAPPFRTASWDSFRHEIFNLPSRALSFASTVEVAVLCGNNDGCYFSTRQSIILGVPETAAAAALQPITLDQGNRTSLIGNTSE